ncbi:MAG: hypothetical protein JO339_02430 [Alphaproteobacteria bacterium]|nr:hypothetical protein [Alphaproteobacteria bacterium]
MKRILLPASAFAIAAFVAASGHADDKAYCADLSALYRKYVQNSPGRQFDVEASVALDQCQKGNTAAAIPVLEKKLRESGFSLPKELKP